MATLEMEKNADVKHVEIAAMKLEMTRVIKASRAKVFEAWTNPEMMKTWFGSPERGVADVSLDVREGGDYRISMISCEDGKQGQVSTATGVYRKIVKDELLEFTWTGDWSPDEPTVVTVKLRDVEGGTELKLTHAGFKSEASRDGHEKGWSGIAARLEKVLEA